MIDADGAFAFTGDGEFKNSRLRLQSVRIGQTLQLNGIFLPP